MTLRRRRQACMHYVFTRQQLHELVWAVPKTMVSGFLGLPQKADGWLVFLSKSRQFFIVSHENDNLQGGTCQA